jgi:hypothetical protein
MSRKTATPNARHSMYRCSNIPQPPSPCRYTPVSLPNATVMTQARKEPRPTLPRRVIRRGVCTRAQDCDPLTSTFSRPGRARKYGHLVGKDGGRFTGELVAGHPEGLGQFFISRNLGSTEYTLVYDGEWVQVRPQFNVCWINCRAHEIDWLHSSK